MKISVLTLHIFLFTQCQYNEERVLYEIIHFLFLYYTGELEREFFLSIHHTHCVVILLYSTLNTSFNRPMWLKLSKNIWIYSSQSIHNAYYVFHIFFYIIYLISIKTRLIKKIFLQVLVSRSVCILKLVYLQRN